MNARQPSATERVAESAMPSGILADLFALAPCDVVGVWSGSLTMIADVSRGAVLIGLSVFSPTAPRRINRGRYGLHDCGTGKLEQMFGLVVSLEPACGGAALAPKALERAWEPARRPTERRWRSPRPA